jgi:hypothetical protein
VGDQQRPLAWRWRGAATTLTDFGDPTTTSYQLCLYDNIFATPALRMDLALPAGGTCGGLPCWQAESSRLRYVDAAGTPSGIVQAKLMAGADGHASIAITGQGRLLAVPAPVPPSTQLPFNFGLALVLRNDTTGVCWAAGYSATRNTRGTLRAVARGT